MSSSSPKAMIKKKSSRHREQASASAEEAGTRATLDITRSEDEDEEAGEDLTLPKTSQQQENEFRQMEEEEQVENESTPHQQNTSSPKIQPQQPSISAAAQVHQERPLAAAAQTTVEQAPASSQEALKAEQRKRDIREVLEYWGNLNLASRLAYLEKYPEIDSDPDTKRYAEDTMRESQQKFEQEERQRKQEIELQQLRQAASKAAAAAASVGVKRKAMEQEAASQLEDAFTPHLTPTEKLEYNLFKTRQSAGQAKLVSLSALSPLSEINSVTEDLRATEERLTALRTRARQRAAEKKARTNAATAIAASAVNRPPLSPPMKSPPSAGARSGTSSQEESDAIFYNASSSAPSARKKARGRHSAGRNPGEARALVEQGIGYQMDELKSPYTGVLRKLEEEGSPARIAGYQYRLLLQGDEMVCTPQALARYKGEGSPEVRSKAEDYDTLEYENLEAIEQDEAENHQDFIAPEDGGSVQDLRNPNPPGQPQINAAELGLLQARQQYGIVTGSQIPQATPMFDRNLISITTRTPPNPQLNLASQAYLSSAAGQRLFGSLIASTAAQSSVRRDTTTEGAAGQGGGGATDRNTRLITVEMDVDNFDSRRVTVEDEEDEEVTMSVRQSTRLQNLQVTFHGTKYTFEQYQSGTAVSATEYLQRYNNFISVTHMDQSRWATNLCWLISDGIVQAEFNSIARQSSENDQDFYIRIGRLFLQRYAPTEQERREMRMAYQKIEKSVSENINDFLARFQTVYTRAHEGESIDTLPAWERLVAALEIDARRHCADFTFDPMTVIPVGVNDRVLRTWNDVAGMLRTFYSSGRVASEVKEIQQNAVLQHRIKSEADTATRRLNQIHYEPKFEGKFNSSLQDRMNRTDDGKEPFENPPPNGELVRMFSRSTSGSNPSSRSVSPHSESRSHSSTHNKKSGRNQRQKIHDDSNRDVKKEEKTVRQIVKKPLVVVKREDREKEERKSESRSPPPICDECCMRHETSSCNRLKIPGDQWYSEWHSMQLGDGPHEKADEADVKAVVAKNGKVGAKYGAISEYKKRVQTYNAAHPTKRMKIPPNLKWDDRSTRFIQVGKQGQKEIFVTGKIGKVECNHMVVDTGSHITLVSHRWFKQHSASLPLMGPPPSYSISMAETSKARALGTLSVALEIADPSTGNKYSQICEIVVISNLSTDVILGMDTICKFGDTIHVATGTIIFRADLVPTVDKRQMNTAFSSALRVVNDVQIPPRTTRLVAVHYDAVMRNQLKPTVPILCRAVTIRSRQGEECKLMFPPHIQDGRSLNNTGNYLLSIINPTYKKMSLKKGLTIGSAVVHSGGVDSLNPQHANKTEYAARLVYVDGEMEFEDESPSSTAMPSASQQ